MRAATARTAVGRDRPAFWPRGPIPSRCKRLGAHRVKGLVCKVPVSGDALRSVMRHWATGITVVTCPTPEGPHGITVNSFTSLSLDPPLCLLCIDKRTKAHALIPSAGAFAVSLLRADQAGISDRFANRRPDLPDLFAGLPLLTAPSGIPVFADALGYLDCTLEAQLPGGDHTIFVGRVQHAAAHVEGTPLLFYGGRYRALGD